MKRVLLSEMAVILLLSFALALLLADEKDLPRVLLSIVQAHQESNARVPLSVVQAQQESSIHTPLPDLLASQSTAQPAVWQPSPTSLLPQPSPTPAATAQPTHPPAEQWKDWPSLPAGISAAMQTVYRRGLELGNDPQAFSILGDCQSQPEVFMGIYDSNPQVVQSLPLELRLTAANFAGSFERYSPTVKDGTTEGSLLWMGWNDNKEGYCNAGESPLDCELRVQRPSIAFIHVGTHWEARNEQYLTRIIETLLERGTVPVIVTKADNRELDERINRTLVKLGKQYELPVWNFWASVQDLPNHGMQENSSMYLSEAGLAVHRQEGLLVLGMLWRALQP